MIKDILTYEYSSISHLTFWLITMSFSYILDKSANEVRVRVLFSIIFFPIVMYFLTKI